MIREVGIDDEKNEVVVLRSMEKILNEVVRLRC